MLVTRFDRCVVGSRRTTLATAAMVLVAVGLLGPATRAAAAAGGGCRPAVEDLGDPFGGHFSYADGVSSAGDVAGTAFLPNGRARAVLWQAGVATNLGTVAPYDESFAHGVNAHGIVVGELDRKQTDVAPFIYDHGAMRQLPGLGGDFGYASGVNDRGQVVGTASDASGRPHAVVWTDDGRRVHDLGIAPGDVASYGSGINGAGTVAGDSDAADQSERPAVFGHGAVALLTTAATRYGAAEDVNDAGRVIGTTFLADGQQHAAVWGPFRARGRDLGTLPGGTRASLVDIDDQGVATGGGNLGVHPDLTHAIIWPGSGPLLALRPLSGHFARDFAVARKLGPDGEAVGASQNASGDIHATIWTCALDQAFLPPPPSAADVPARAAPSVATSSGPGSSRWLLPSVLRLTFRPA